VDADLSSVPDDIDALKAALIAARAEAVAVSAELAHARAVAANDRSLITLLKLEIEKLRRAIYGPRSERTARLLDQLELQLEEAEADATEDELAAEQATRSTTVKSFERKRPSRKPFLIICRASALSFPRRRPVRAAARPNCRSSAKTSRRRWRSSRVDGR
jgi:transposase